MDIKRSILFVKLESGVIIQTRRNKEFGIGDKLWVAYDFTRNRVSKVYKFNPSMEEEEHKTEEVELAEVGDDEDIIETPSSDDSGALRPGSDGWEFWNPDSGILELS